MINVIMIMMALIMGIIFVRRYDDDDHRWSYATGKSYAGFDATHGIDPTASMYTNHGVDLQNEPIQPAAHATGVTRGPTARLRPPKMDQHSLQPMQPVPPEGPPQGFDLPKWTKNNSHWCHLMSHRTDS